MLRESTIECCGNCTYFRADKKYQPEEGGWCRNSVLTMRKMIYPHYPAIYSLQVNNADMLIIGILANVESSCFRVRNLISVGYTQTPSTN